MNEKIKILKYLEITNHTATSLEYINKICDIQNVFDVKVISIFYKSYKDIKKAVKVNNKNCISISYCLLRNELLLGKADDDFFVQILIDNDEIINLSDRLELRLVEIINNSDNPDSHLFKYINIYNNKLVMTENSIKYIKNDASYFLSYSGNSKNVIREILSKNKDDKFKQEVINYIKSQGCINNIILYTSIILNQYKLFYINNIDIEQLEKNICYRHKMGYLENCKLLKRYLITKGDIEVILKYPNEINNIDILFKNDLWFEEACVIYLINKPLVNENEIREIINKIGSDNFYLNEYCHIKNFNPENTVKKHKRKLDLEKCKMHLQTYEDIVSKQTKSCDTVNNSKNVYVDNSLINQIENKHKEGNLSTNLTLDCNTIGDCVNLTCKNNSIETVSVNPQGFNNNTIPKDFSINDIETKKYSINEISNILDIIFSTYDFKNSYDIITKVLKYYKKEVVIKIQLYLIRILEEGFFEECYFDIVRNLYNKLLKCVTDTKTRKNNDIILISLSKYCKYFNKEVHIGNVKNKH